MNRKNIIYSVADLATELKISRRTILRAVRSGKLRTVKFSPTTFRLDGEDVDDWIASLKKP